MDVDALVKEASRQDLPEGVRANLNWVITQELVKKVSTADVEEVSRGLEYLQGIHAGPESVDFLFTDQIAKSQVFSDRGAGMDPTVGMRNGRRVDKREHKAVLSVNEFGIVTSPGDKSRWLEKVTGFDFLKVMVAQVDVIKAIILTRQRQIIPFLRPERKDSGPLGIRVTRRDGEDLTDADKGPCQQVMEFLQNSGTLKGIERQRRRRDTLVGFVGKLIWDTLSYDACPIELISTNGGRLSGYHSVSGDTIRLCTEEGYEGDDQICAVQVLEGIPHAVFGYDDLIYRIRNPRADINIGGYGYAEPEMVIRGLTAYLNAVTYNASGLDRNAMPRGMLTLFGEYGKPQLDDFTRRLQAMMQGAANRWRFPVLASKTDKAGAVYTPFDTNFNEMFFARWMTFLISIVCACYGIDPAEIHFDSFSIRPSSLSGSDTAEKIANSRDKGLIPLLSFVEDTLNVIVERFNPKYMVEFVGLHQEEAKSVEARQMASSKVDELRAIDGKEPWDDPDIGNAPTNPVLQQIYMAKLNQRIAAESGGQGGEQTGGAGGQQQQSAWGDEEDYQVDAGGEHNPYGINPNGGEPNPPPEQEHFHSLNLGSQPGGGEAKKKKGGGFTGKAKLPDTFVVIQPFRKVA